LKTNQTEIIGRDMAELIPETIKVDTRRVSCDGASSIRAGSGYRPAALGHPLVYMEIDDSGYVDCGYCDRRFVLRGGPADEGPANTGPANTGDEKTAA